MRRRPTHDVLAIPHDVRGVAATTTTGHMQGVRNRPTLARHANNTTYVAVWYGFDAR